MNTATLSVSIVLFADCNNRHSQRIHCHFAGFDYRHAERIYFLCSVRTHYAYEYLKSQRIHGVFAGCAYQYSQRTHCLFAGF